LERIANIPKRGLGEATLEQLFGIADDEGLGIYELLEDDVLLDRVAVGRAAKPMKDLARVWRLLRKLPLGSPSACVRGVIELTGLEQHYVATEEAGEGQERVANVREVITAAEQYHENHPEGGLPGFLELVALVTDSQIVDRSEQPDQVTLMTLHGAKGLEFRFVFITGCEDGVLPLQRMGQTADLEEERRLMYVGITRAKEELYLSRARCRMQYGQTFRNDPSLFLSEIPEDCFEAKDASGRRILPTGETVKGSARVEAPGTRVQELVGKAALDRAMAMGLTTGLDLKDASRKERKAFYDAPLVLEGDPYQPGERILHSIFGPGEVMAMKGPRENRTILIQFDAHGAKELQMSFAAGKLSKA
nr:ATP-binding domain-containing protein [Planctomycetota bacterium]